MEAGDQHRAGHRVGVERATFVAAERLATVEQLGVDVQHAQVVQQAGARSHGHVVDRCAALADQVRAQQRHQDAVLEDRRPRLARQRQVERDRPWHRDRLDRLQQHAAHAPGRAHQREERPARQRRLAGVAQRLAVDERLGLDAFVEWRRELMRDQPVVQARIDRDAALEQLDAMAVVDRARRGDRPAFAELTDRLQEGRAVGMVDRRIGSIGAGDGHRRARALA